MACFLLHHRHLPAEFRVAFASFRGDPSPLRRTHTISSCRTGGHEIWWLVHATSEEEALELLPPYVAHRTDAIPIRKVRIP
jgi:hypothetical protein